MNPFGSSAINPALLGQYSQSYNPGINPSQLMNGQNIASANPISPLSPSQLLQQQQQQLAQQQRGTMNGSMNINMQSLGMMSAAPASPQNSMLSAMNNMMPGQQSAPITATSLIAMGHHPNSQLPPSMPAMASSMSGLQSQQMMAYNQQQQMAQVPNPKLMMSQQMQLQQHQQLSQPYDRPPSSGSIHGPLNQQMMPPSQRPPTAQSSRPGTAMGIPSRVPTDGSPSNIMNPSLHSHTPNSSAENGIIPTSMYPSGTPSSIPTTSMSPPPQPGSPSPYRTGMPNSNINPMKRKMPDQSHMAMAPGMNMMAPPGMPQQQQNLNGFSPSQIQAQTQQLRGSPGPMGNVGMASMNMNGMATMGMGQSPIGGGGIGSIAGMGNLNIGINDTMAMGMGGLAQQNPVIPPSTPSQSQTMQPQQQAMLMGQTGFSDVQQPIRQGSLPPPGSAQQIGTPLKASPSRMPSVAPPSSIPTAPSTIAAESPVPSLAPSTSSSSTSLPPLPSNVNPATTKVTVVSLLGSDKTIPPLSQEEISQIQDWMKVDKEYEGRYRKMKERMNEELRADTLGPLSIRWWEKGAVSVNPGVTGGWRSRARENFDVRYPRRKDRDGRNRKPGKREGLKLPRTLDPDLANCPEQLVPIRLEFDVDHHKMRDTFVWNLNDPVVTPEHFAQTVVEDYNLSYNYHSIIAKSIHDQLNDFKAHSNNYDGEGGEFLSTVSTLQAGSLGDDTNPWWEAWRNRLRTDHPFKSKVNQISKRRKGIPKIEDEDSLSQASDEKPLAVEDFAVKEDLMHEDMRILIKLDIIVGSLKLDDQFEWDLDNAFASPEHFAEVYTQELGLGGEFRTAIAHSIREQVQTYQKSLFLVGHATDGSPIQDEDLKLSFLPPLVTGARSLDQVHSFTPLLNYLSDGEVERNEKERDKEINRRKKRNTRGRRGVTLPDREPIRTYRTPAIGFPELDAASQAAVAAASAPARRAAAAAASLTIANMVASENGTPFLPQSVPSAPQPIPTVPKKKPKGLYKAPPIPRHLLRPRANVNAPTPSTAADIATLPAPLENDPPPSVSAPLDTRVPRILTAKRAKEMEREAKEKEFADGQHANYIDGIWHCSNCGCPEGIAIGRRKGPLGEKSQCGTCGKYWHRHRRPRPVEYNTDREFHSALKRESEIAKTFAKKKGGAAALRAQSTTVPTTPAEIPSEPPTPTRSKGSDELVSKASPTPAVDDDRAVSPVSTVSSGSEAPLAQRVKLNGTTSTQVTPSDLDPPISASSPKELANTGVASEPPASPSRTWPPPWLATAMQATHLKYPNDRFDVALRRVNASTPPEWRIKCVDCPGKLYKPGPGETLSNFEVHLRNRQHRQRVDDRVNAGDP